MWIRDKLGIKLNRSLRMLKTKLIEMLLKDVEIEELVVKKLKTSRKSIIITPTEITFPDGTMQNTAFVGYPVVLKRLADIGVTTDVQYVDITGLDINTHRHYLLISNLKNPLDVATAYYMFVEGDYTVGNYSSQRLYALGTSVYASRVTNPTIGLALAYRRTLIVVNLVRDPAGYPRATCHSSYLLGGEIRVEVDAWMRAVTATNITSIRIYATQAGGIGAGSRIVLYGGEA